MSTINAGANPDDLDALASKFGHAAGTVRSIQQSLNPQIMNAPWAGRNADAFRQHWNGVHRRAFVDAISFLDKNASDLRRNAEQQRNASQAGSGSGGPAGGQPVGDVSAASDVRSALLALGLSVEQAKALMDEFHDAKWLLGLLNKLVDIPNLGTVLGALGKVGTGLSLMSDFLTDLGEHPELPFDEAMVHAVAETGVRFAVGAGVEAASQWATTALLTAVTGGVGAVPGYVVGTAIGFVVGKIVDMGVDAAKENGIDVYEGSADLALDAFRDFKSHDYNLGATAIDGVAHAGKAVVDGAENLVKGSAAGLRDVVSSIRPFD